MKTNWTRIVMAGCVALAVAGTAGAATYTSLTSGNYGTNTTWNEGGNPGTGTVSDVVTINSPHAVTVVNAFEASNDTITVNSGATLKTPITGTIRNRYAHSRIRLNGGILFSDNVTGWEGAQPGSVVSVKANSIIDTIDSWPTPVAGAGNTQYGSLVIDPTVSLLVFTNSYWAINTNQSSADFIDRVIVSNDVEIRVETTNQWALFKNLAIDPGRILTKTGAGTLQIDGNAPSNGNIVVREGTIQPKKGKALGTNEITILEGATLFVDYISTSDALLNLPVSLKGGRLNWRYTAWPQTSKGNITIRTNSIINIYNDNFEIFNFRGIAFDTLAFDPDPSGAGYELHCTHIGSHANWTNTVLYSQFLLPCMIGNSAVINADRNAGAWFDKAVVIATNKTLTKKGEGVLIFNGAVTNAGTLSLEAGAMSILGPFALNGATSTLANSATAGTNLITASGGARGFGDLVLANNTALTNGITLSTVGVTNTGRIINSGTGSGSVLISAAIGTNVSGLMQGSASSPLILSGANSYTGGTLIASGILRIANTTGSATGPGAVTIAAGATLQGAGSMAGSVTNSHNGTLSPGLDGAPGATMTMGYLTWNGGGVVKCEVASIANNEAGAGLDYDQIIVTNTLTAVPAGSNLVLRLDTLGQTLAFETNRNYSLKVITCGKSAVLNPAEVTLDTNAFLVGGTWSLTNLNNALYVVCLGASPSGKNYWRGTGNWSAPANWSLGHSPLAGEDVEFDFLDVSNCTVDVVGVNPGSLTLAAGYTGTVTLSNLTVSGNCIIGNGVLTHAANGTTAQGERYKINLTVGGNLQIASNGQINADGKGYSAGNGPGAGTASYYPGSYGGKGGGIIYTSGPTYGVITAPTNIGSGGKSFPGGGAIRLTVGGTTDVNGVISAKGGGLASPDYSPGSGGSVFLTTGSLTGGGRISANGGFGAGYSIGSGGGGRVAVILTNSTDFGAVRKQAYPGEGGFPNGAAGTVYLEHTGHVSGQGVLIVDNNDLVVSYPTINTTLQNGKDPSTYAFSEIILTNAGIYALDTNDTLNILGTTVRGDPSDRNDGIYLAGGALTIPSAFGFTNYFVAVGLTNATFLPSASLTVGTNATIKFDVPWTVNYPITLEGGGWMSHSPNVASETYKLNLTVNGNLDIQANGQVNVDGMGYYISGPGKAGFYTSGGSYGGVGGIAGGSPGMTYGSITAPTNFGSSGNGAADSGGGCVQLRVTGTTILNGVMSAGGMNTDNNSSGGAGGSVFLTTGSVAGNGTIRANGGNAPGNYSTGGGGRLAVILTNSSDFANLVMQAYPGTSVSGVGGAGTIYLESQAQGPGNGRLVIDSSNRVGATAAVTGTTLISSNVTDTVVGTVMITNKAVLAVNTNQTLTVNGSWTNAAKFVSATNGTVVFASADPATITGSNVFYNLAITNAGKVVSFEAGKTNLVYGMLKLGSTAPDSTVTLKSTVDGSQWFIALTNLAAGGTQQIARVTVKDSNAGGGQLLTAVKGSVNGGNNVNWFIPKIGGTVIWVR